MASSNVRSTVMVLLSVLLVAFGVYLIDPTFFGLLNGYDGFADADPNANYAATPGMVEMPGKKAKGDTEANENSEGGDMPAMPAVVSGFVGGMKMMDDASGNRADGFVNKMDGSGNQADGFANMEDVTGPAAFEASAGPAGCYPRDQLTPGELLPKDPNSVWAQQNPMGTGSLKGKNFLSAGALIGVNTVGQTLRNANYQLRSEPANPQVPVSVFNNSTIEPDTNRRDMEIN
jgi:hypothetical protein